MRITKYSLILCHLFMTSNALNCRSQGPKESELKNIYNICMKQQIKSNSNNNSGDEDQDWRESRRYNHWSQDNVAKNRGYSGSDYEYGERLRGEETRMGNRDKADEQNEMRQHNRGSKNRDNRMQYRDTGADETMYSADGRGERKTSNGDNRYQRNKGVNDRNDFSQNENYSGYNTNQYTTQSSRRYKRERRVEVNSGKRSQYNPNLHNFSGIENRNKDSNESNSTNVDDRKACAIHCLLEKMQMTSENGMPDRYLVTHTITKDVKDEDLKDFLQESIEECFQILDNENIDQKCELSERLIMCLSEKGRANCDDWQDNFYFS